MAVAPVMGDDAADTTTPLYWEFASPDARTAPSRRSEFSNFLRQYGTHGSDFSAAELIFGELVANVVRHAPGKIRIRVEWNDVAPTLHVDDGGHGFRWQPYLPRDPLAEFKRGLFIVQKLSGDVRVHASQLSGARVSVVLPVERRVDVAVC